MNIVVATHNMGKLAELRALLPSSWTLYTLQDVGLESPEETGESFKENALLKARAAATSGFAAVADDSGLQVAALDGAPGIFSARYSGPDASDEANNRYLIQQMREIDVESRQAQFVSAVVLVLPGGLEHVAIGTLAGSILDAPRGTGGFGYDPLFVIDDLDAGAFNGRTLAELSRDEKNQVSHRSRAYRALVAMFGSGS